MSAATARAASEFSRLAATISLSPGGEGRGEGGPLFCLEVSYSRSESTRQTEVQFVDLIAGRAQAQARVGLLGPNVIGVHIQAQTADIAALLGLFANKFVKRSEHVAPTPIRADINTLNPPKVAIAPIAPFQGDEQLADERGRGFGHPVNAFGRVGQDGGNARAQEGSIQFQMLRFLSEERVELRDDRRVQRCRLAKRNTGAQAMIGLRRMDFSAIAKFRSSYALMASLHKQKGGGKRSRSASQIMRRPAIRHGNFEPRSGVRK